MGFAVILGALALTLCTKSYSLDRTKQRKGRGAGKMREAPQATGIAAISNPSPEEKS